jgi:hypothetical protein
LAKGGWFTAFYIMDIYLPRSQHQGSGNRYSGYFLLLHLTPFFKRSILAWIDGDGGGLILVYTLLTTILTIPTYILEPKFDSCIFYSLSLLPVLQPPSLACLARYSTLRLISPTIIPSSSRSRVPNSQIGKVEGYHNNAPRCTPIPHRRSPAIANPISISLSLNLRPPSPPSIFSPQLSIQIKISSHPPQPNRSFSAPDSQPIASATANP